MVVKDIVNNTTEICMDAHILRMNYDLVGRVMKLGNVEFSEQEFSNAIVSINLVDHNDLIDNKLFSSWES